MQVSELTKKKLLSQTEQLSEGIEVEVSRAHSLQLEGHS